MRVDKLPRDKEFASLFKFSVSASDSISSNGAGGGGGGGLASTAVSTFGRAGRANLYLSSSGELQPRAGAMPCPSSRESPLAVPESLASVASEGSQAVEKKGTIEGMICFYRLTSVNRMIRNRY